MVNVLATEGSYAGDPAKLYRKQSEDSDQLASVAIGDNGSLLLQGHTDVLKEDVVLRSQVLTAAANSARPGSMKTLPVPVDTVMLWLSVVKADDKKLESLSALQFSRTLTAIEAMEDAATLAEVCTAQRDRVVAATATPVAKPRASPYSRLPLPNSLRRLASGSLLREPLHSIASYKSEAASSPQRKAERPAQQQPPPAAAAAKRGGWASKLLCCGGTAPEEHDSSRGVLQRVNTDGSAAAHSGGAHKRPMSTSGHSGSSSRRRDGAEAAAVAAVPSHVPVAASTERFFEEGGDAPLLWLEQVVANISEDLTLRLLQPAFATLLSARPTCEPPRPDLPPHLLLHAVHAALPGIQAHNDFTVTLASAARGALVSAVLAQLNSVSTVTLQVGAFEGCEAALADAMHAACALPQLHELRVSLLDRNACIPVPELNLIASTLASATSLQSLAMHAGCAADDAATAAFAVALCHLPNLCELELTGAAARPLAPALSSQISSLSALQSLHVDDKDVSDACVVHLVRAAAALPALTALHLDAEGHVELPREKFCSGRRTRQLIAAVACATRLHSLSLYAPVAEGRSVHAWCGLGGELAEHGGRFEQLTRLELIGSVSASQLPGVSKFISRMTPLRALHIETGENDCGGAWDDDVIGDFAGALSALTQLTAVGLTGPDVAATHTVEALRGLGRRTGVKKLSIVGGEKGTARDLAAMVASNFPALDDLTLECDRAVQQLHGCRGYAGLVAQAARFPRLASLCLVVRGKLAAEVEAEMLALGLRRLSQVQELLLCVSMSDAAVLAPLLQIAPLEEEAGEGGGSAVERAGPGMGALEVLDLSLVKLGGGAGHALTQGELRGVAEVAQGVALLGLPCLQEVMLAEGPLTAESIQG